MLRCVSRRGSVDPLAACFPSTSRNGDDLATSGRWVQHRLRGRPTGEQLFAGRRETLTALTFGLQLGLPSTFRGAGVASYANEAGAAQGMEEGREGKGKVLTKSKAEALLDEMTAGGKKTSVYTATDQTASAVDKLIKDYADSGRFDRGCEDSFALGQGTWEVFYAPHIRNLSKSLQTEFSPLRYVLVGNSIRSYVHYSSFMFGSGWLSASGYISAEDANTLRIHFDSFWLDENDQLRQSLDHSELSSLDKVVNFLGRLGFIPAFAIFPVLSVSKKYAVFRFPPLQSNIAIKRITEAEA